MERKYMLGPILLSKASQGKIFTIENGVWPQEALLAEHIESEDDAIYVNGELFGKYNDEVVAISYSDEVTVVYPDMESPEKQYHICAVQESAELYVNAIKHYVYNSISSDIQQRYANEIKSLLLVKNNKTYNGDYGWLCIYADIESIKKEQKINSSNCYIKTSDDIRLPCKYLYRAFISLDKPIEVTDGSDVYTKPFCMALAITNEWAVWFI